MDTPPESGQPSRRRRRSSRGAAGQGVPDGSGFDGSSSGPSISQRRARSGSHDGSREIDYRPTQLSFESAFRAREVATPSPEDLAEAAENLILVRRNYIPRDTGD
ncbi:MAG: hypothetical protein ABI382_07705 [Nakamurella sp.]